MAELLQHALPAPTRRPPYWKSTVLRRKALGDPAGTGTFTEGATMTKAAGDATSIAVPASAGTYKLHVVDAQAKNLGGSAAQLRVRSHAAVGATAVAPTLLPRPAVAAGAGERGYRERT
ncbi:hypothetical protein [Sorangium sp. So ce693]|uniref:hypothetical protein n=1 Tax=Sorangium sp. So ce693 TaxID=3133318 RepID=UPI003F5D696D